MLADAEAAILKRVIAPEAGGLPRPLAELVLSLDFPPADQVRMEELAQKSNAGTLTPEEHEHLQGYVNVGHLLALLQSKARTSLARGTAA
jgi:hypothetical protein